MINVILCGGNGTRLWPISRTLFPKQFSKIAGNSLFQETILRNSKFSSRKLLITNQEQKFLAQDQLKEIGINDTTFILEPIGRNTAAAIAFACHSVDENEILLVTPSDHLIKDLVEYEKVINQGIKLAEEGNIVTFGITPTYPETGYGYIQANDQTVVSFKEKPTLEIAKNYLKGGNFYWNSGMFMFKAKDFLRELETYAPEIFSLTKEAVLTADVNNEDISIKNEKMMKIPDISVDYAVMEKSNLLKIIPSNINWSDMGSFESLYDGLDFPEDKQGNKSNSQKYINVNSNNNLVLSEKTIATINVDDLIVVDTADALLISSKGSSHEVKKVVKQLKEEQPNLVDIHLTAHRPWGVYTILEESPGFKIKKIVVKPGKKLSLQKHHHRNEHWVVVSGTATVTIGEKEFFVRPNESTYIKMGEVHRLENSGKIDLVLIEVQVGEYLEEDDIIRLEDDFSRL